MFSMWESTCELEQDFNYYRMLGGRQKANTSPDLIACLLKVLLDGPSPQDLAPFHKQANGSVTYVPSHKVLQIQCAYRQAYGVTLLRKRTADDEKLPRRETKSRAKKRGLAAFLRVREQEMTSASTSPAESMEDLKKISSREAEATKCHGETLAATLQANLMKTRKHTEIYASGRPDDETLKKLKLEEGQLKKKLDDIDLLQRRDLTANKGQEKFIDSDLCALMVATSDIDLTKTQAKALENLGLRWRRWRPDESMMDRLISKKHIIWFAPSEKMEHTLIEAMDEDKDCCLLASRLFGGHVAGREWLDSCVEAGRVVRPVLYLESAVTARNHEIAFHESLPQRPNLDKMMLKLFKDPTKEIRWVLHHSRKKLCHA